MKAFLVQTDADVVYQRAGEWAPVTEEHYSFANGSADKVSNPTAGVPEPFVRSPNASLVERFRMRAPGAYQAGE